MPRRKFNFVVHKEWDFHYNAKDTSSLWSKVTNLIIILKDYNNFSAIFHVYFTLRKFPNTYGGKCIRCLVWLLLRQL